MKLDNQLTVNAPAGEVWQVVAHQFADVGLWASGVAHSDANLEASVPDGASVGGRVCSVPGFGDIRETFTAYDEVGKTYTYEATGMPFFVKQALNTWHIEPLDAQTTQVRFAAELTLMPVIGSIMGIPMRRQLSKLLANITEELKYYIETGHVHPRKQALLAKSPAAAAV